MLCYVNRLTVTRIMSL